MQGLSDVTRLLKFKGATTWQQVRTPARLSRLANDANPAAQRIAQAIRRAQRGEVGDGQAWIDKIEDERERLLQCTDPLVEEGEKSGLYDGNKSIQEACKVSKGAGMARVLYALVEAFSPACGIELGTNLGISASYQAAAMKSGGGRLTTLEGSPARAHIARGVFEAVGLDNVMCKIGLFTDTLRETLEEMGSVDYAFIDGHHLKQPTLDYFDEIYPHLAEGALVIFDDIRYSRGMREAWSLLKRDIRIKVAVDLGRMGVCIISKEPSPSNRCVTSVIYYE